MLASPPREAAPAAADRSVRPVPRAGDAGASGTCRKTGKRVDCGLRFGIPPVAAASCPGKSARPRSLGFGGRHHGSTASARAATGRRLPRGLDDDSPCDRCRQRAKAMGRRHGRGDARATRFLHGPRHSHHAPTARRDVRWSCRTAGNSQRRADARAGDDARYLPMAASREPLRWPRRRAQAMRLVTATAVASDNVVQGQSCIGANASRPVHSTDHRKTDTS